MPMIRVRDKHQITLPKEIVLNLNLKPNSYIEYQIMPEGVFIRSVQFQPKEPVDIFKYAGIGKKRLFKTAQEADQFISDLRDEWER